MSRSRPEPMDREPTSLPPAFPWPDPRHPRMRPLPPLGLQAGHVGEVGTWDEHVPRWSEGSPTCVAG